MDNKQCESNRVGATKDKQTEKHVPGRVYDYTPRPSHQDLLTSGQRDIKAIVGENVHKYRLEAGINRTAFGLMVGYQSSNVKRLEEGGMNLGIEKLQQIANTLSVTVIDLCEDWEGMEENK